MRATIRLYIAEKGATIMATCTFFGHRDCPETIKPKLREVLINLITNHSVERKYLQQKIRTVSGRDFAAHGTHAGFGNLHPAETGGWIVMF